MRPSANVVLNQFHGPLAPTLSYVKLLWVELPCKETHLKQSGDANYALIGSWIDCWQLG